jgi:hypothetical protein
MRRAALAVIAITLATSSAGAHCYRVWRYPTPQRCFTAYAPEALQHRAEEQSHDWNIEITKLPPAWNLDEHIEVTVPDDPERARGLIKLKEQLK